MCRTLNCLLTTSVHIRASSLLYNYNSYASSQLETWRSTPSSLFVYAKSSREITALRQRPKTSGGPKWRVSARRPQPAAVDFPNFDGVSARAQDIGELFNPPKTYSTTPEAILRTKPVAARRSQTSIDDNSTNMERVPKRCATLGIKGGAEET